jgi:nicotinate-nucleotide adenylyltransferase
MRVGLYGGSFDPAHSGHAHVARIAVNRLRLDRVLWLVSPGNPLKPAARADLERRLAGARRLARGPRMQVSDAESRMGLRYTIDTIRALKARFPGVRFVWIMGADSLASFHRWKGWAELISEIPVAVISRPGAAIRAGLSPTARRFAWARRPPSAAARLPFATPPAWAFLQARWNFSSSTALRARRRGRLDP